MYLLRRNSNNKSYYRSRKKDSWEINGNIIQDNSRGPVATKYLCLKMHIDNYELLSYHQSYSFSTGTINCPISSNVNKMLVNRGHFLSILHFIVNIVSRQQTAV